MNTEKKDNSWISVDALRPKLWAEVQAWTDKGIWLPEAYYGSDGEWRECLRGVWMLTKHRITHWMPQPEGPPTPPLFDIDTDINRPQLVQHSDAWTFIPAWIEATKDMTPVQIACAVWDLGNERWCAGRKHGLNEKYYEDV